jgi:hypothetical protein
MAKRPVSVSARSAARRLRGGPTFIQRSRSVSSEEKAIYHNVTGAGRSGVIREFMGLTPDDETTLGKTLEASIQSRIGRTA